jgi:hypothetical protein
VYPFQLLTHHLGIAPVSMELLLQPVLQPPKPLLPYRRLVGDPAAGLQIAAHRVLAYPQLTRNALDSPAQGPQPLHHSPIFWCLHLVPPEHLLPKD